MGRARVGSRGDRPDAGLVASTQLGLLVERMEDDLGAFLNRADDRVIADDDKLDEAIRRTVRQVAMDEVGKKPEVTVVVSRLMAD